MKIKLFTLFAILSIVLLSSCSKDDEGSNLDGTKWVTSYGTKYYIVLEFSNNKVYGYFADEDMLIYGSQTQSTYTMSGDDIVFQDLTINWLSIAQYKYTNATIANSIMTAPYEWKYNSSESWLSGTDKFQKQ
ncbi:MAG: hypothetical protein SNJ33_04505 [Rikenellaceae bacterium]